MTIQVSAFTWVPPFAEGHVRDLRVRWALEEAGLLYEAALIDQDGKNTPEYRGWQPFGQVPAYRDDEVELFESGAIVLHLAHRSNALAPSDPAGRARVATWVLCALNTLEPDIASLGGLDLFHAGEAWTAARRPQLEATVRRRLGELATALGDRPYLEGRFTGGDIAMTTVLRSVEPEMLATFATLAAYRERNEARPAFGRALAAQIEPFRANAP
jgi:glutathione S-transferase